jgi:hypothetical protein
MIQKSTPGCFPARRMRKHRPNLWLENFFIKLFKAIMVPKKRAATQTDA